MIRDLRLSLSLLTPPSPPPVSASPPPYSPLSSTPWAAPPTNPVSPPPCRQETRFCFTLLSPPPRGSPLEELWFLGPEPPQPSHQPNTLSYASRSCPCEEEHNQEDQESRPSSRKKRLCKARNKNKGPTITPPFPWAKSNRATIYSLEHLLSNDVKKISGNVRCESCNARYEIEFDLEEKFSRLCEFIRENHHTLHDRAPDSWTKPVLPRCDRCNRENSLKPVIIKKRSTNWLFLLLGQLIGCCKRSHLSYFCKHNVSHRTGAKDRLIYLTYMGLCQQLDPNGPFNVRS